MCKQLDFNSFQGMYFQWPHEMEIRIPNMLNLNSAFMAANVFFEYLICVFVLIKNLLMTFTIYLESLKFFITIFVSYI